MSRDDDPREADAQFHALIDPLIDAADLDGLVRIVDSLCSSRDWPAVLRTRDACRAATRTGRQVWPIATLCEYRLALHAPAPWACRVVDDEASRFSIGPLTEVVAQNHTWSELRDHLAPGPQRELIAHERVIRGDTIDALDPDTSHSATTVLDIPLLLSNWEPTYPLANYSDDGVLASSPCDHWTHEWTEVSARQDPVVEFDDDETVAALRGLVEPWTAASGGRSHCLVVEGGLDVLVTALDRPRVRAASLTAHQALQWLAWCGASAGAHGRRRGAAAGRFNTWWMVAALADAVADWDDLRDSGRLSDELGRTVARLKWHRIDLGERHSYELSLAATDDDEGVTFGLFAFDDPM